MRAKLPEGSRAQIVIGQMTKAVLEDWDTEKVYAPGLRKALEEQFGYQYPYEGSQTRKLKFTVSELKKRAYLMENGEEDGEILYEEPEIIPLLPEFLKENEEMTGASRGTAYHRLLEILDFRRDYDKESLREAVESFRDTGRLDRKMAEAIRLGDILTFLNSATGKRACKAAKNGKLRKEQPFVLGVDAKELYKEEEDGEIILVQGIIDVYFEEDDGLVVLDYKTDKVKTSQELAEKYHAQLDYYGKALEQMTQKKVKEKIIYSFTLKEEIILP